MKRLESPLLSISAVQDSKDFPKRQTNQSYNLTQSPNGFFCSLPERMSLFAFILWHVFTRKMQFFSSRHIFAIRAFSPFWEGMSRHVNAVGSIWAFKKVWQKCQKRVEECRFGKASSSSMLMLLVLKAYLNTSQGQLQCILKAVATQQPYGLLGCFGRAAAFTFHHPQRQKSLLMHYLKDSKKS